LNSHIVLLADSFTRDINDDDSIADAPLTHVASVKDSLVQMYIDEGGTGYQKPIAPAGKHNARLGCID